MLDKKFDIKEWKKLGRDSVKYLGQSWRQFDQKIEIDMDDYIQEKLEPLVIPKKEPLSNITDASGHEIFLCASIRRKPKPAPI